MRAAVAGSAVVPVEQEGFPPEPVVAAVALGFPVLRAERRCQVLAVELWAQALFWLAVLGLWPQAV